MRLATIWAIPAMPFAERLRRTGDWAAMTLAAGLPTRVRYWAFIQVGAEAIRPDEQVTVPTFVELLDRASQGGPRS